MAKEKASILIIDDDPDVLLTAKLVLKQQFSDIRTGSRPTELLDLLNFNQYDVVLLDMNFTTGAISGKEGLHWLKTILKKSPDTHVIMVTAYGDIDLAVQAMKLGASDFVVKPWDNDKLVLSVQAALRKQKSAQESHTPIPGSNPPEAGHIPKAPHPGARPGLNSAAPAMQAVLNTIRKVAGTDVNVLILGENGTGKEVAARSLHALSSRKDQVFVNVDLGAIPETLFESELFGHKKGAFTDAREDRPGKFEAADGGTLFLDEIGNLSPPLQSKLLTVLQSRTVTRIGSNQPKEIDIRLICATNMPLYQMVKDNSFRQDLLYRINTVEVELPALRHRKEDILQLAGDFLNLYSGKYGKGKLQIAPDTLEKLNRYHWPGNIRELQHAVERAVIMADEATLHPRDFPLHFELESHDDNLSTGRETESFNLDEMEKTAITNAIEKHQGNLSAAAKELGLGRSTLYRRMSRYGL